MSSKRRYFGALLSHDVVALVEYATERTGLRVVSQWTDRGHSASIDGALARLASLLQSVGADDVTLSLAIEQFGVFHHVMMLPGAPDEVLRPVIRREVQRVFGVVDPVIAFSRGSSSERRSAPRADERTAPRQLFIAGAPRDTIEALGRPFVGQRVDVEVATVVPKAVHALYRASGAAPEPTAVLVCLEGGPHLSYFLDGRLELAMDPPIALEGERATVPMIVDQVERGAVYFRQQFRGATATRLLLAARSDEYDALAAALEASLGAKVTPLFAGTTSPEAVVAMGAVLEARGEGSLDLFPHPPTLADRVSAMFRGPSVAVAAATAAAVAAGVWALFQFTALERVRTDAAAYTQSARDGIVAVEPMRRIAEQRADIAHAVTFVRTATNERAALTGTMAAIARETPADIAFDSLRVSRTPNGWSAAIDGQASGATAAQAVRTLDLFVSAVRAKPDVSATSLDQFDYPTAPSDSARAAARGVTIAFRLTFALSRDAGSEGR